MRNKGGVVGAWLADLLLYLFGVSAWWWVFAGVVLVVAGYRHLTRQDEAAERHHPWLAVPGFALVLLVERGARGACGSIACRRRCPTRRRRARAT